jgi:Fe-S-cluster containining protein
MRFACNKTDPKCKRCAECCKFRDKPFLTDDENHDLSEAMFKKSKIIYLFPFSRYTISLTEHEKATLEQKAKELNITIKILPKKTFYNSDSNEVFILDYFLDHDVCPFLEDGKCSIYDFRPEICKLFPHGASTMKKDVDDYLDNNKTYNNLTFEESVKKVKEKLNLQSKSI